MVDIRKEMSAKLKLISVNIERERHLSEVVPFLSAEKPDVVCLQELRERDIPEIERALNAHCVFTPMLIRGGMVEGIGICTALPVQNAVSYQYAGSKELIPYDTTNSDTKRKSQKYTLSACEIEKDGTIFTIATTHFPWTPDGQASDLQRTALQALLETVKPLNEFVLCGDFNAPRGREIFAELAKQFKDNIPSHYITSLDKNLHKAGELKYVVDGLFTTPGVAASDVKLHFGVSDHAAVVATITV